MADSDVYAMIEYLTHGLLAVPLVFLSLKFLSYLSGQPITRGTALVWCVATPFAGTLALIIHGVFFLILGICATSKFLTSRGGWFDKHI